MIEFKTTKPQTSDYGDGFGELSFAPGTTLNKILAFLKESTNSWGEVIITKGDKVIRHFDYNTFHMQQFFYNLDFWQYDFEVKSVTYRYCFMNKDFYIEVK